MKIKKKIIVYFTIFVLYTVSTFCFFKASDFVDFDPMYPLLAFLGIIDTFYFYKYLKLTLWLSVLSSATVVFLSLACAFKTIDFGFYPKFDWLGIVSVMIYNGLYTILFLEVIYQVNKRLTTANRRFKKLPGFW